MFKKKKKYKPLYEKFINFYNITNFDGEENEKKNICFSLYAGNDLNSNNSSK